MKDKNDGVKREDVALGKQMAASEGGSQDVKVSEGQGASIKTPFTKITGGEQSLSGGILDDDLSDLDAFDKVGKSDFRFVSEDSQIEGQDIVKRELEPFSANLGEAPFGEASSAERGFTEEEQQRQGAKVEFRRPKVGVAKIDRGSIYPVKEKELRGNENPKEERSAQSIASEKVGEVENKAEKMEVLPVNERKENSLSESSEPTKPVSKWAFWKRPSRKDEQLARISEGYLEMVDLVRAIRGQLESQNENNIILRDSLSHLPKAMEGFDKFSESQETVGKALQEIHGQLERTSVKDDRLVNSMDGFNETLQGMDVTNRATMKTFDRVQERMGDSDRRMESLFENVQGTEEKVSDTMVRLQRNMAIMQGIFLFCLMVVLAVLVFFVMKNLESAPDQILEEPSKAEVFIEPRSHPQGDPREVRRIGIFPADDQEE